MGKTYNKPTRDSTPTQGAGEIVEGTLQHPDFLSDLLAIEREARNLGSAELVHVAEKIKNAELRLLRGVGVSHKELRALAELVERNTVHTNAAREPSLAEVSHA